MTYDVITLGETMLRLTPPQFQRIEQAHQFEIHVGGSESNVVSGLSRLGLRTAWLSRLTANPVGRLITSQIQAHGVDVSHVVWTNEDRVGLYFLEEGKAPRGSQVIYDRADSAVSQMTPDELPAGLFQPGAARLLHLSGITPALGPNAAATTLHAAQQAKAAGWQFCFDINYRARLWSPQEAVEGCEPLAALADILILPLRDAVSLYGTPNNAEAALAHLRERYPNPLIVLTLSAAGSACLAPEGTFTQQASFPAEPIGRLGGGDAFVAGFLYATLSGYGLDDRLRWGNAAAAHKYSTPGDLPFYTRDELAALVASGEAKGLNR